MSGKGKQHSKKSLTKPTSKDPNSGKPAQPSASATSALSHSDSSSESSEAVISLPVIKMLDNAKILPKYASILERSSDEGINMEDLDTLQLELEMLLTSAVLRSRMLQEEIASLSASEERRDRRSKSGKGLLDKKLRDDKLKPKEIGLKSQSPLTAKLLKQRALGSGGTTANQLVPNPHELVRVEGSKSEQSKLLLPKNDTLNKFWASVDPYCADIMPEDLKLLEELIASHGDLGEYKKIPQLGKHYSLAWAQQDLMAEEEAGCGGKEKKKGRGDLAAIMAKGEKKANGIAGPLTQRLVSALLEENVYVANNNTDSKLFRDGDPPVLRDLSIQNSMNLELRMHKELVDQGILDSDPKKPGLVAAEDDEILQEIKRCQRELTALSSHNESQLRRLLRLAQEESKRQALKRKIAAVDQEVVEHYEKLLQAKQRKQPLVRKEQEKAWGCLREREMLLKQLDMLPANSLGEPVKVQENSVEV